MSGKYDKRIARGMAFLDEHVPGWTDRISLDRLNLFDCKACVVGQLIGSEDKDRTWRGLRQLVPGYGYGAAFPDEMGFSTAMGTYPGLTRAWKRAIQARRSDVASARAGSGEDADGA